jgi:hypothetical protein
VKANQLKGNQKQSKETKVNQPNDLSELEVLHYIQFWMAVGADHRLISIFGSVGSVMSFFRPIAVGMIAGDFCQAHNCMSVLASSAEYKKLKSYRCEREIASELHMILTFRKLEIESRSIGIN